MARVGISIRLCVSSCLYQNFLYTRKVSDGYAHGWGHVGGAKIRCRPETGRPTVVGRSDPTWDQMTEAQKSIPGPTRPERRPHSQPKNTAAGALGRAGRSPTKPHCMHDNTRFRLDYRGAKSANQGGQTAYQARRSRRLVTDGGLDTAELDEGDVVVYEDTYDYTTIGVVDETPPWTEQIGEETIKRDTEVRLRVDDTFPTYTVVGPDRIVGRFEDTEPDVDKPGLRDKLVTDGGRPELGCNCRHLPDGATCARCAARDDHDDLDELVTDGGRPDEDMERLEELYGLPEDHFDDREDSDDDD